LRQQALAKKLRCHQSWVARVESGQRRIDVIEFLTLAEAIGFSPNKVLRAVQSVDAPRRRKGKARSARSPVPSRAEM
jgi:hypothetical protein